MLGHPVGVSLNVELLPPRRHLDDLGLLHFVSGRGTGQRRVPTRGRTVRHSIALHKARRLQGQRGQLTRRWPTPCGPALWVTSRRRSPFIGLDTWGEPWGAVPWGSLQKGLPAGSWFLQAVLRRTASGAGRNALQSTPRNGYSASPPRHGGRPPEGYAFYSLHPFVKSRDLILLSIHNPLSLQNRRSRDGNHRIRNLVLEETRQASAEYP